MNGLALRLMLGLAWLILAPIASAESRVWIGVTIYDDASARIRDGTVVLVVMRVAQHTQRAYGQVTSSSKLMAYASPTQIISSV